MDVNTLSNAITTPSIQKVTEVTSRVEGTGLEDSKVENPKGSVQGVSVEQMAVHIEQFNSKMEAAGHSVRFGLDDSGSTLLVKVVDKSTEELIRQLPSEDALKVMQNIEEFLNRMQQTGRLDKESLTGSLVNEII